MILEPTYQAARLVAATIETHFAQQLTSTCKAKCQPLAPNPPARVIEAMIDAAFWASLRHEEGYSPKISLAYISIEQADQPLVFEHRLPLTPAVLTKLAPAVERPGIHLGIGYENDELFVWGTTREIPGNCFVLEVIEPGLLVVKHRRLAGYGKFVNVAILKGDQVKIVDNSLTDLPDYLASLTCMPGFQASQGKNVLVQLAVSMRAHGRGGSLLVVPSGSEAWRESIIQPMTYPIVPPHSQLADLMRHNLYETTQYSWQKSLDLSIESMAGLTAVDGATIINDQYDLLGFGAKIGRSETSARVEQILVSEPIVDQTSTVIHSTQTGGTRHLSAAQFVYDQRDAVALVASQDGRFTVFVWSPAEEMVHAHRIDSLLL
ncbi:putative sensor domain DACNV-containing protein [Siphonobacter sp.]|uniref:putative sensor domain DACNV-containing protein n=1 Tax=Siphonobacter sp. TaxID=1869184 RepID=UPI003B3BB3DC